MEFVPLKNARLLQHIFLNVGLEMCVWSCACTVILFLFQTHWYKNTHTHPKGFMLYSMRLTQLRSALFLQQIWSKQILFVIYNFNETPILVVLHFFRIRMAPYFINTYIFFYTYSMKQLLLHAIIGFKIEHFYMQHVSDVIVWWQEVEHVGIKNRHTWRDDMFQHIFLKQWIRMQLHTCKSNKTLNKPCNNNDKNRNCEFSNYCWLLPLVVCDWMRKWANWVLGKSPNLFGTAVQKQPMNFEFHNMSSCFMPIQIQDHYMAHASMMCASTIYNLLVCILRMNSYA